MKKSLSKKSSVGKIPTERVSIKIQDSALRTSNQTVRNKVNMMAQSVHANSVVTILKKEKIKFTKAESFNSKCKGLT